MHSKLKYTFGIVMALLVALTIAFAPDHPILKQDRLNTHVLESNALYFKNLRQFYYEYSEDERSGYNIYDHPDQKLFSPMAPRFKIIDNWRQDQAYLLLESKNASSQDMRLVIETLNSIDTFSLVDINTVQSLNVSAKIFDSLGNEGVGFSLVINNEVENIWQTQDERRLIKTILKDYFKLVGAL